jgi:redox-sensitive bicupin YhaK (pirin superfamily)
MYTTPRTAVSVVPAVRTTEGAGFAVRRPFPSPSIEQVDPFLLIDEMGPTQWAPGEATLAPDHPHRGFETVTYLLAGSVHHEDSAGGGGLIGPGDVQWMTAGSGVVHSEQWADEFKAAGGLGHGFQIWVNLPAAQKMMPPRYQGVPRDEIPTGTSDDGLATARVVAGAALGVSAVIETVTPIQFVHWTLQPGAQVTQAVPPDHHGLLYPFVNALKVGGDTRHINEGELAMLGDGDHVTFAVPADAGDPTEVLFLSGVPINEPVARYGPFVMNTREEIMQAVDDYQSGRMGTITR